MNIDLLVLLIILISTIIILFIGFLIKLFIGWLLEKYCEKQEMERKKGFKILLEDETPNISKEDERKISIILSILLTLFAISALGSGFTLIADHKAANNIFSGLLIIVIIGLFIFALWTLMKIRKLKKEFKEKRIGSQMSDIDEQKL